MIRTVVDKEAKPQIVTNEPAINAASTPPKGYGAGDGNRGKRHSDICKIASVGAARQTDCPIVIREKTVNWATVVKWGTKTRVLNARIQGWCRRCAPRTDDRTAAHGALFVGKITTALGNLVVAA